MEEGITTTIGSAEGLGQAELSSWLDGKIAEGTANAENQYDWGDAPEQPAGEADSVVTPPTGVVESAQEQQAETAPSAEGQPSAEGSAEAEHPEARPQDAQAEQPGEDYAGYKDLEAFKNGHKHLRGTATRLAQENAELRARNAQLQSQFKLQSAPQRFEDLSPGEQKRYVDAARDSGRDPEELWERDRAVRQTVQEELKSVLDSQISVQRDQAFGYLEELAATKYSKHFEEMSQRIGGNPVLMEFLEQQTPSDLVAFGAQYLEACYKACEYDRILPNIDQMRKDAYREGYENARKEAQQARTIKQGAATEASRAQTPSVTGAAPSAQRPTGKLIDSLLRAKESAGSIIHD